MPLSVSVVVVSRRRPGWLKRCLTALGQLDYPSFEIVVIACGKGIEATKSIATTRPLIAVEFEEANISKARNLGVLHSAGSVVAFIDDDAVPEPTWLSHLVKAFADPMVLQAGGTSLGRNGISVQHAAARVTPSGETIPVEVSGAQPVEITTQGPNLPRLHGTNMAFRKIDLMNLGGFDPAFAFYLDETDLNVRVARSGGKTVFAPNAVVHHASAASDVRNRARVPRDVYQIAFSTAVFHKKHVDAAERDAAKEKFLAERRKWLLRHLQSGALSADDIYQKLNTLRRGYEDGLESEFSRHKPLPNALCRDIPTIGPPFSEDVYLTSNLLSRSMTHKRAKTLVAEGKRVTLFEFTPSVRYHQIQFLAEGYWLHRGGIFGREVRTEPFVQFSSRKTRIEKSLTRLTGIRSTEQPLPAKRANFGK